jgi:CBS domain-containing protein
MLVRELMTSPAVTIRPVAAVAEAARLLDRLCLTSLPVVDHELRLVGIISEAELITWLATPSPTREGGPLVGELMTTRVLTVAADDEVAQVVALMSGTILKSLPVLLHDRVVGMISRRDVVRAIAHGDIDARHAHELSRV